MMRLVRCWSAGLLALATFVPAIAGAQGTAADYARAEGYRERTSGLIVDDADLPVWLSKGDRFWYRKSVEGGHAFVMVDAAARSKRPAFDHARLAAALSRAMQDTITAVTLPFRGFSLVDGDSAIEFAMGAGPGAGRPVVTRERWRCTITDYVCDRAAVVRDTSWRAQRNWGGGLFGDRGEAPNRPQRSPDGKWESFIRNYNVFLRRVGEDEGVMLSTDGSEGDAYDAASISWSPDSRHIAAYRVRPGYKREVHYIESSPEDQLQPRHSMLLYNKPGDVLDVERPVVFDVAARKQIAVDSTLFPNAYSMTGMVWRKDGRSFTFEYNQRGHQVYRVIEVDAATGKTRAVIDEVSPTFFEYSAKLYRYDIADGKEIIWMSERDGWNQLYLYDGA
ncbi:MAG TPA: DPP IV N-terminal domain-containing protein, partial [Gemmatimonadaceae bacterium]|nr:DPP IV N-terminal domain-containing protein [Gemmatimonadaceae bacterium]